MGEIARALGEGTTLEFKGQPYKLAPVNYEVQAQFELWLEKRAWEGIRRAAANLPPEGLAELAALRSQVSQDVAAGVYSWGSTASVNATQTAAGQKQLLYLMLSAARGNPPVSLK